MRRLILVTAILLAGCGWQMWNEVDPAAQPVVYGSGGRSAPAPSSTDSREVLDRQRSEQRQREILQRQQDAADAAENARHRR